MECAYHNAVMLDFNLGLEIKNFCLELKP